MLKKMSKLGGFLAGFWREETSQVSKIEILKVASILAVLSVAAMPRIAAADVYPCSQCPNPYCDEDTCNWVRNCPNEPNCSEYWMPCNPLYYPDGYYVKLCAGTVVYCNTRCT